MTLDNTPFHTAGDLRPRRCFASSITLLRDKRLRRILALAGCKPRIGLAGKDDSVLIWGDANTAARGHKMAARKGAQKIYLEDAFLRSVHTGRQGDAPLGLLIDRQGLHFDGNHPSDLEDLLNRTALDDTALLDRARDCIARIRALHLSKYNAFDPQTPPPAPGYVLVIDQTQGDASVRASNGDIQTFREMLIDAQADNPGQRVLIRTHPETAAGLRKGHYSDADLSERVSFCDAAISPWHLLEGATAVYTLSSQLGFEAILAGHKPHVYGQPFYAGWGLTQDRAAPARRRRNLTRAQLFAGAMILYPVWYDPYRDRLCQIETVIDALHAQARAWREDHAGWVATGVRLWKRGTFARFFTRNIRFQNHPDAARALAQSRKSRWMVWAGKAHDDWDCVRVEDGFLRSKGLGAELVPPLSLVCDRQGIYYDPTRPSDLETILNKAAPLRRDQLERAEFLISRLRNDRLSKYNLGGAVPDLPPGLRILVPGQVEDDASIRKGAGTETTNLALLQRVRAENPDATLLYKPHPDVEAGLRAGAIPPETLEGLVDMVLPNTDPIAILDQVDGVWTMTSTLGFEALLRGVPVTTLGAPFYAGWGLTHDLGPVPDRRTARLELETLVHGALIAYPRYVDPVTGLPCPVEVAVDRLSQGDLPSGDPALRMLSKLQGLLASYAYLWR